MALTQPTNSEIALQNDFFGATVADGDYILGTSDDDVITGGNEDIDSTVSDGIDTLEGGDGDDTYIVKNLTDVVVEIANQGIDTVWSTLSYTLSAEVENIGASGSGASTLTGNALNNKLDGSHSSGINTLSGLAGNDTYFLGAGDKVTEAANSGTDTVVAAFDINLTTLTNFTTATSAANVENVTLIAGTGTDITGNALANILIGNSNANTIIGNNGDDVLDTGTGGTDILNGGAGNDTYIVRSDATATFVDSAGIDLVKSFADIDVSSAAVIENITLLDGAAIDATGNSLANVLTGNKAINVLTGNDGNDTLDGKAGSDELIGGKGNDILIGGTGTNTLSGGEGSDTYKVVSGTDIIEGEVAGTTGGTDKIEFSGTDTTHTLAMGANVENLTMFGSEDLKADGNALKNSMTGNDGDNTLDGGADDDTLDGGKGNDTLKGGEGKDTLKGGEATTSNTLEGGNGDDTYVVIDADDNITEASAATSATSGVDLVKYEGVDEADTFVMDDNVENLIMGGTAALKATGNTGANTMTGNAANNTLNGGGGNDILDGKAGNDTMKGGNGNDTYTVDSETDVVDETGVTGNDTVNSSKNFILADGVENLILTGTTGLSGTGNSGVNSITGNSGANAISGLGGNDILNGAAGADNINGGDGNDSITGGSGRDDVTTGTGSDTIKFAAGVLDTVATTSTTTSISGVDLFRDLLLNGTTSDKIDLTVDVANVGDAVTGALNTNGFIANMNTLLTQTDLGFKTNIGGIDAAVVTATSGTLSGRAFLAVDLNASDTFTSSDFVIEITGSTVTDLTIDTFV